MTRIRELTKYSREEVMWRFLARAPYGDDTVVFGYDGELLDEPVSRAEVPPPLDPIDEDLVGGADTRAMYKRAKDLGFLALEAMLAMIMAVSLVPAALWMAAVRPDYKRMPVVGMRYADHMAALRRAGLLRTGAAAFYSGYFAVPKSKVTSRSIFNGRRLSRACPIPPPVNLMGVNEVVSKLKDHLHIHGRMNVVVGDFRHWFHQLPAPEHLQRLFGLRTKTQQYTWRCLPMGWSFRRR